MHVWAETFKEPPIPGVKTIKIETGKHQSPNEERIQNEKGILPKKIITAESSLQLAEQNFPSCVSRSSTLQPSPKSIAVRPDRCSGRSQCAEVHLQSQTFLALLQLRREPPDA